MFYCSIKKYISYGVDTPINKNTEQFSLFIF